MTSQPRGISVLGVHPIEPSQELFCKTLEIQWGKGLSGKELERAEENVRAHFAGLHLIEVQLDPAHASMDWYDVTQPVPDEPKSDWQVPYDARVVDEASGRWAFFFHFLDLNKPLQTSVGPLRLPAPTPRPQHLSGFEYEAP